MIITIGNTKGGVGKTTIACNLAVIAASKRKKVLLVDADKQASATSFRAARTKDDITCVSKYTSDLHKDLPSFSGFDLIIVDAGGRDSEVFRSAILGCQVLLIPSLPSQVDLWAAEDAIAILKAARARRVDDIKAMFVLNQVQSNTVLSKVAKTAANTFKESDVFPLKTQLHARVSYKETLGQGIGVIEGTDAKAGKEMLELYNEIMTIWGGKRK